MLWTPVAQAELDQQGGAGCLEVEAVLQHGWLRGCSLGGEIDGHKAFKLFPQFASRASTELRVSPRPLQPMERLIHLHHVIMKSGKKTHHQRI